MLDGEETTLLHSEVASKEYEIDYVFQEGNDGEDNEIQVYAWTNRDNRISWAEGKGVNLGLAYEFMDAVDTYVTENQLPEEYEELTQDQEAAYLEFESGLRSSLLGVNPAPEGGLESRVAGLGVCSRNCAPGGGILQVIGVKPFITQRNWRNSISSCTGVLTPASVGTFAGFSIFDRSWYRRGRGTYWGRWGNEICLDGTRGNNVANSLIIY